MNIKETPVKIKQFAQKHAAVIAGVSGLIGGAVIVNAYYQGGGVKLLLTEDQIEDMNELPASGACYEVDGTQYVLYKKDWK